MHMGGNVLMGFQGRSADNPGEIKAKVVGCSAEEIRWDWLRFRVATAASSLVEIPGVAAFAITRRTVSSLAAFSLPSALAPSLLIGPLGCWMLTWR